MSSRQLTHIKSDPLVMGLNFSINSKTLPNKDIIVTMEDAVKDLEKEEVDAISLLEKRLHLITNFLI